MWIVLWTVTVICRCPAISAMSEEQIEFAFTYFLSQSVAAVTSLSCLTEDNFRISKKFSEAGIPVNYLNPENRDETFVASHLTSRYCRLGILLDLKCNGSRNILRIAHKNDLFIQRKSLAAWLIMFNEYISSETISFKAEAYQPETSDPIEYLTEPYYDTNNSELLAKINRQFNAKFIQKYRYFKKLGESPLGTSDVEVILPLNILLDNEVLLAVPSTGAELYKLYRVNKVTRNTKMTVERSGSVFTDAGNVFIDETELMPKKKSLQGTVLRGVTAILNVEKFTKLDDLSTRDTEAWPKLSYNVVQLLEDDLNFSSIIRFFDAYGWMNDNHTFNGLMGHLQKGKADMSVAYLVIRSDRFPIVDYLDSPHRLQVGILFREPSLPSVRNMFLLPFSSVVWISTIILIIVIISSLTCLSLVARRCNIPDITLTFTEIVFFTVAAFAQQGYHSIPKSTSVRLILLLLLFSCFALFTAFSAKVVALMQSFSSSILSVDDITRSRFQVGIQSNFPLFRVYFEETVPYQAVIRDFYNKKVLNQGGRVYYEPKDGIEKMRRGLFAYEVELTVAYKLISDKYEEIDKCGIKEIDVFPKPFLGLVLPKNSPYMETFKRRMRWLAEVGFIRSIWNKWIQQKPQCEAGRIGFLSVGLNESYPAIMFFLYGCAAAISVLIIECLCNGLSHYNRRLNR